MPTDQNFNLGDIAIDADGRVYQRIGTDADPHPWRYITSRTDLASYPESVGPHDDRWPVEPIAVVARDGRAVQRDALAEAVRAIRADRNESRRGDLAGLNRAAEIVERIAAQGPSMRPQSIPPTPIRPLS